MYEQFLSSTDSDYVRDMLSDLEVTGDEYSDAISRIEDCVNGAFPDIQPPPFAVIRGEPGQGFKTTFQGPTEIANGQLADQVFDACFAQFGGLALAAYDEQIANPKNFDRGAVAIKCLVDAGLVAANYSSENLAADLFWDDPNHPNVDDVQGPVPPEDDATPLDITGLSAADCLRVLSGGPVG